MDPVTHAGCAHGGWRETPIAAVPLQALAAARTAATYASADLGLDIIRIRFFEPGPIFSWTPLAVDREMVVLNAGDFDWRLKGKACHPEITPLPTVWVRSGLSPALTAAVVLHEARHVWQFGDVWQYTSGEEDETDAHAYMWRTLLHVGFDDEDVARAFQEAMV